HIRLKVKHSGTSWDAVGFDLGAYSGEIAHFMDIVYNLELNRWNGTETLRLNLIDFEPSR
ncbi:single-stranded-DNA-specific exonuclease RecJ, partial [Chloroflexota bacterium]